MCRLSVWLVVNRFFGCSKMSSFEAPKKFLAELPDDQSGQVQACSVRNVVMQLVAVLLC